MSCQGILLKGSRLATAEDYDEVCFCDGACVKGLGFEKLKLEMGGRGVNRLLARDSTPEMRKQWLSEGVEVRYIDEEMEQMEGLKESGLKFFLVGAERRKISHLADGVMVNAVQIKKAAQLEPWRSEYKGQIMLDNGIFGDTLLSVDELVGRVNTIVPDVVVGPDVLYDRDIHTKSLQRQKEFIGKQMPKETETMLVPQGNTVLEYEWCVKEILKLKPAIMGIGRMSIKVAGYPGRGHKQRVYALNRIEKMGLLDEIKSEGIRLHALGLSKPWELPYLNKFGFWSLDSMSYIYSSIYNQLAMPGDPTESSFTLTDGQVRQTRNVEDDVHRRRVAFAKNYPHSGELDTRQEWIVQNIWRPLSRVKATEYHVLNSIRDLKFEDRDDVPMLEKPRKEGMNGKVLAALQEGGKASVSDLENVNVADLDNDELRTYHFLLHVAWKREGGG